MEVEQEAPIDKFVRERNKEIMAELLQCIPLYALAIVVAIAAYNSILIPCEEKPEIWFQRSGSIVVLLAVWIEYKLIKINGDVNPSGASYSQLQELNTKYGTAHKVASYLVAVLAISGTFIWGYGDFFV